MEEIDGAVRVFRIMGVVLGFVVLGGLVAGGFHGTWLFAKSGHRVAATLCAVAAMGAGITFMLLGKHYAA